MDEQTNVPPYAPPATRPLNPLNTAPPTPPIASAAAVPAPGAVQIKYAGFWIRVVAAIVDGFVLGIIVLIVGLFIPADAEKSLVGQFISTLISWIYFVWLTNSTQSTLGKKLVGLKVQSVDGQKLSFGNVVLRETIGKFVSAIILGIGYIMVAFSQKKQGLHDMLAKSVVIYKDPSAQNRTGLIIGISVAALLPALVIVSLLASIVLVSLNSARSKGFDAQVISNVYSLSNIAELYYTENQDSYAGFCSSGYSGSALIFTSIAEKNGRGSAGMLCTDSQSQFAISSELRTGKYVCKDSTPYSTIENTSLHSGTACR